MNARTIDVPAGGPSRLLRLCCLAGLIAVVGCGADRLGKLSPVEGKVTVNGAALTSGEVRLHPETPPKPGVVAESMAQVGADGSYKVTTNGKPGAPLGKYKVTVTVMQSTGDTDPAKSAAAPAPTKESPKLFNPRFENPGDTPLQIDVVASPSPGHYDLKLTR